FRSGNVAVQKRGLDHQHIGVADVFGQAVCHFGIAHDNKFLASLWRPEDVFGIDRSTVSERYRPAVCQFLAHRAVRHSEGSEAFRPKMTAGLAFEGEAEAVRVAMSDWKATDREVAGVEDPAGRQRDELK